MVPTSHELVELARTQIGKPYVLGADVDLADPNPPEFDCAEFATWLGYQKKRRLFGCIDNSVPVELAEPYSGSWAADARSGVLVRTTISAALTTPAVFLIRKPIKGRIGHVAMSDGLGGTIEAHSRKYGVSEHPISGRVWDYACMLPGVEYRGAIASPLPSYQPPSFVLRIGANGDLVVQLKRALAERGYWKLPLDSQTAPIYGRQTEAAVARFQADHDLLVDGEAGPQTFRALGISA